MTERSLRLATVVLSIVGAAISAYLVYVHETGGAPICVSGGCGTVQHSAYAEMFGVPVAMLGLVGFVGLLVAAIARGNGRGLHRRRWRSLPSCSARTSSLSRSP